MVWEFMSLTSLRDVFGCFASNHSAVVEAKSFVSFEPLRIERLRKKELKVRGFLFLLFIGRFVCPSVEARRHKPPSYKHRASTDES